MTFLRPWYRDLLLGIGFIQMAFSDRTKVLADRSYADSQRQLDGLQGHNEQKLPQSANLFTGYGNTTQHLKEKQPTPRD